MAIKKVDFEGEQKGEQKVDFGVEDGGDQLGELKVGRLGDRRVDHDRD